MKTKKQIITNSNTCVTNEINCLSWCRTKQNKRKTLTYKENGEVDDVSFSPLPLHLRDQTAPSSRKIPVPCLRLFYTLVFKISKRLWIASEWKPTTSQQSRLFFDELKATTNQPTSSILCILFHTPKHDDVDAMIVL